MTVYMRCTLCVLILSSMMIFSACTEEREVGVDDLIGTWEVKAAERNGRATETLNGALFEFRTDGSMMTNISGEEDEGSFTFENGQIRHNGALAADYQIREFETDSMSLNVILHQMHFALDLRRATNE